MKRLVLISAVLVICICCFMGCSHKCPPHNYQIENRVEATCTEPGSITYKCSKCGNEYTAETDPRGHRPGAEATEDTVQRCLDCGAVLNDPDDDVTVVKNNVRTLPVNHYRGVSQSYWEARIDTQLHAKYSLPTQNYKTRTKKQQNLDINIPIQEFYTHDVLSVYELSTEDGKTFVTDSGFKIKFNIETEPQPVYVENENGIPIGGLNAAIYGDFLDNYDKEHWDSLRVVRSYPTSPGYEKIYLVVDFSQAYIEIEKDGDASSAQKVYLEGKGNEIVISPRDTAKDLFFDEGTYRILFKYNLAWVTNPSSPVIPVGNNDNSIECYPYGFVNDQYDYFYITITDKKANTLLATDYGTSDELFYQLRADSTNNELFIAPNSTIAFSKTVRFYVDAILENSNGSFSFDGRELQTFKFALYRYDRGSDTGEPDAEPYILYDEYDLLQSISDGNSILEIRNDPILRGRRCKIVVSSTFYDSVTKRTEEVEQTYKFTFAWE